jgi:hypothetical protein
MNNWDEITLELEASSNSTLKMEIVLDDSVM